ncbi:phosphoribosyltransferase family protein [Streptomyces sp. NPDC051976]|uniref:phosphoribosyltransferase family protein n=1 Tax=Streptomyces sp. NPDC051976 TaxID=3154947 RepID=UPI00341CCF22
MIFVDRHDAGRQLADMLSAGLPDGNVVVLGLPRGGVPVAAEVAHVLGAPLDVCLVRKLGVPRRPELAMGAIGEGRVRVRNEDVLAASRITPDVLAASEARERAVLERAALAFRKDRPPIDVTGRTVVLVDDGIATGASARAACQVVRARGAARVVMAVPVAPSGWTSTLGDAANSYVCPHTPRDFAGVGQFYADFSQTSDAEVMDCLLRADRESGRRAATENPGHAGTTGISREEEVTIPVEGARLQGDLTVSDDVRTVVVFAHGSGSSRHSTRNRFVARTLNRAGLGTLLFDLLTPQEAEDRAQVFDVHLLASRLGTAVRWLREQPETKDIRVGLFGASTGAAAALWAATQPDADIAAIVCRGGRPDLAEPRLALVTAPTLLIVGSHDPVVLGLNRQARARLRCPSDLAVVPGATHLFEEPGTLPAVARLAGDWFARHMIPASDARARGSSGSTAHEGSPPGRGSTS